MNTAIVTLTLALSAGLEADALCSIESRDGTGPWRPTLENTISLVHRAHAIVLATAIRSDTIVAANGRRAFAVAFHVTEVLTGDDSLPREISFVGYLSERDDFNPGPVPYVHVRSSGQRGSCYAQDYRLGAQYLFLLQYRNDRLTPYWAWLSPVNEQIRGADDPWVAWVRAEHARTPRD